MARIGFNLLSLESMAYQSSKLFAELTESIEFLRADGQYTTKEILESGIQERLRTRTKMQINFIINAKTGYGAYMHMPLMDKNHPFINEAFREWNTSREGIAWLNGMKQKASLDFEKGEVGGLFMDIPVDITLGLSLIGDRRFSAEEIASIILHELGHAWTYFVHLGTTVISGLHAGMLAREVMGVSSTEERVKLISQSERALGIEIPNKEELARLNAKQLGNGVQMVVITSVAEKQRSETGHRVYEMRACEQIADEYAVKYGAGRSLVTALEKLYRIYGQTSSFRSAPLHILIEAAKAIGFLFLVFFGGPATGFLLMTRILLTNPLESSYDKPEARALLIKQRIIGQLKDRELPAEKVHQLKADVEVIDGVLAGMRDKSTLVELFWSNYMTEGSSAAKGIAFNKRLEELLYNDLFTEASSFRTGSMEHIDPK